MSEISHSFKENVLDINGKKIEFPSKIKKVIVLKKSLKSYLLVVLRYSVMRNVFLYDEEGNEIWQIERNGSGLGGSAYTSVDASCADGVHVLIGAYGGGHDYTVDFDTGKVTKISKGRPW